MASPTHTIQPPSSLRCACVVFTGKLASMKRAEAHELVRAAGGEPLSGVSRRTTMLVIGMEGWPLLPDGSISAKLRRVEELNCQGGHIAIVSEEVFLELAGLRERCATVRKKYPADQICRLVDIRPDVLRRWEQLSLVRAQDGLYDFQDIVSLRTIAELSERGVQPEVIARSLRGLASVLPGTDRPLAQLRIVAEGPKSLLAELDDCLVASDGQLLLVFRAEPRPDGATIPFSRKTATADDWFEHAEWHEEEEHYNEAADAYRQVLAIEPRRADAHFNLGNVLRALGDGDGAAEQFGAAIEIAPGMACAWFNLADVQEEQGRIDEVIPSLRSALEASPAYADAHFNLAMCYEKAGRCSDAQRHWAKYLALDPDSEWAEVARKHQTVQATPLAATE